jgi:signal transduction histidine kinase
MVGAPRARFGAWPTAQLRDVQWLRAALLDVLLAAVVTYAATILTLEINAMAGGRLAPWGVLVAFLHGASILVRRVATKAMLAALLITAGLYTALGYPVYMLGPAVLVAAYTVGARWPRRRGLVALAAVDGATLLLAVSGSSYPGIDSMGFFLGLITAAWFLGDVVRRWQTLAREHAAQVTELQAAREELARHAVTNERMRIARELHDVVAHAMSIVAMHAGAGRLAVGRDPEAERAALEVIEETTRGALAEMRRLVAVLREDGTAGTELSPMHGLADLPELVAGVAAAGISIDVRATGDLASLPDGVSLAAYRVVQEALTNVVRHAGPTKARVVVHAGGDGSLDVSVENDQGARRRAADPAGGRHGRSGMRERVELYGGTLTSGPAPDGGWRVTARLHGTPERSRAGR